MYLAFFASVELTKKEALEAEVDGLERNYEFKSQKKRRHVAAAWNKNLNSDFQEKLKG